MRKGLKRVLAYVLTLTMVFGTVSIDASAFEGDEVSEEVVFDEVSEDVSAGEAVLAEEEPVAENEDVLDVSGEDAETPDEEIELTEEVKDEGAFAFLWDGTKITGYEGSPVPDNLKIPANCTAIATKAFSGKINITKLTFQGSAVTEIAAGAFTNCSGLKFVNFQNGLIKIGDNCFSGCSSLEDFTLADSLTTIGASAFKGCASLTEVTIPSNVVKIGADAFRNCTKLSKVEIDSNSVTSTNANIFADCDIKTIDFDSSVTKIPGSLFANAGLNDACVLNVPVNCTSINSKAFQGSNLKVVKFLGNKVTAIGSYAFSGTKLSEINLPSSVTSIGEGAFKDCKEIGAVSIPEKVTTIGADAFRDCELLSEVEFKGNALKSTETNIFKGCVIETITLSDKMTVIPAKLFYGTTFVGTCVLHIPAKVDTVGDQAFKESTIKNLVFDGVSLKKIGDQAFMTCSNLVSVDVPYGCTTIGTKNFNDCESLVKVSLPDSVTTIGANCFDGSDNVVLHTPEDCTAYKYAKNHKPDEIPVVCNFSIVYNLDGGLNAEDNPNSYKSGEVFVFEAPTRTGYDFGGWFTDKNFVNDIFSTEDRTEKLTLYAKWTITNYVITYDYDGGKTVSNPATYTINSEIKFMNPTKAGFSFEGWYIDSKKVTGIKKGTTGAITVTAKWKEYWYTIKFNANGGKGTTNNMSVRYTAAKNLTANGFYRDGYDFVGWNTKADGKGTPYHDEEEVAKLVTKNAGTINLYAQWRIEEYNVFYDLDGGTNNSKNPTAYTIKKAVKLVNPTKTGYTFLGWFDNGAFAGVKTTGFKAGQSGEKTFYAKWSENQYKIAINRNGSDVTGAVSSPGYVGYDDGVTLPDGTGLSRKGYEFTGFNTKANGTGTHYDPNEVVCSLTDKKNGTVLLYVEWTPVQYGISYELYGGSNSSKNPDYYTIAQKIILANAVMDGFTFQGWYRESTYENKVTTINKGSQAEYSLHAKWSENSYKLVFDKNGGKLVGTLPAGATYKFTDAVELPLGDNLSKTGYDLTGWNTKSNGKGTHYELEDTVSGIMSANNKSVKLYAEWTPVSHDVNYYNLEGATNPNPDKHTEIANLTLKNPTKTGYTFKGWYTDAEFTHKITVIAKSDMEADVYAKWQANTYTVVFNKNGGTGTMDSFKCTYDNAYDLPYCTLTRTGYHFAGWNTKGNGTGTAYADEAEIVNLISKNGGKVTLYAQWERD